MPPLCRRLRFTHLAILAAFATAATIYSDTSTVAEEESTSTPKPTSSAAEAPSERGFRWLTTKAYLTPDFDQEVFDRLYTTWEPEARAAAEQATPAERRRLAFERYGLTEYPDGPRRTALQYVDDGAGGWAMNCLACHTGKVAGRVILGAPNTLYDLQTLTEEVRSVKFMLGKPLTHMDKGSLVYPLGGSRGTTNAVMFGQILLAFRDADLTFHRDRTPPPPAHHDMDAPPWWHYRLKTRLYIDGFAPKDCRALMQFLLIPRNGPDKFAAWEADFRDVDAWISSLEPPKYPFVVDRDLAEAGRAVFNRSCAGCHGRYDGDAGTAPSEKTAWPEKTVALAEVGTDAVRLESLSVEGRAKYGQSWFTHFGEQKVTADPQGYVAPPLTGLWASAPYLHNGSVPTLWHLLHADARPVVWQRSIDGYDEQRVGLEVRELTELPEADRADARTRRRYFDTRLKGKSAVGHTFPEALNEPDKRALLEYLKTL